MKKKSHWMITSYALRNRLTPSKRFFIKLGCVMPDILLYTFKRGHYYTSTKDHVLSQMDKLVLSDDTSFLSCYRFGYNLHFVEDYFTYPHNFPYWKNRKPHYTYEVDLQKEIPFFLASYVSSRIDDRIPSSFLEKFHISYLERAGDSLTDLAFMVPIVEHLVNLFCKE